ncbi:short-chain dehydrogenase [Stemphylium lycopersici]|uniref:Short-chain dehydrogenase n=1 Tax=Stemphylium lycopersici TaxID=183478 RepID=A0A364MYL0_STELY|nr:short-chain dehydrogenase [Stemphylium lycopersici]RAQ99345.1 short-chain dehydrogenase [Stemphylium lycopersici]RAR07152.1 short-chain dehydrogenase [Stemphylium lycopersici]
MGFLYSQFFRTPAYPNGNFSGKTIIVTGSNVGLGKEAARHYARLGANKLILAVRSVDKGQAAKEDIVRTTGHKDTQVWKLDMGDYRSIQSFSKRAEAELERIDIFIANAGVVRAKYHEVNGHEEGIAVNVIATTLLMANMMPKMRETANRFNTRPTFTITGSAAYEHTTFPQRSAPDGQILTTLSDRETCKKYWSQQYPVSKLVQLLIVRAIADHHPAPEFPVTVNIVNPGLCWSELAREATSWGFWFFRLVVARSTEVGSRTLVHAGTSGIETHGKYLSDCMVEEPSPLVTDAAGKEGQERIAAEVIKTIEEIQPGVSKKFQTL